MKMYEIYLERINSQKKNLDYLNEIEIMKRGIVIKKEDEDYCLEVLERILNKDKKKLLEEVEFQYNQFEENAQMEYLEEEEEIEN